MYVDGVAVKTDAETPLDDFVAGTTVAAVEVYASPSAAPIEFSASKLCGVVVIWTRPPGTPSR